MDAKQLAQWYNHQQMTTLAQRREAERQQARNATVYSGTFAGVDNGRALINLAAGGDPQPIAALIGNSGIPGQSGQITRPGEGSIALANFGGNTNGYGGGAATTGEYVPSNPTVAKAARINSGSGVNPLILATEDRDLILFTPTGDIVPVRAVGVQSLGTASSRWDVWADDLDCNTLTLAPGAAVGRVWTCQSSTGAGAWAVATGMSGGRELLVAARTYYVRTDGSNTNNGLSNTAGGAYLTVQFAIDVISKTLDNGGYDITIKIADGTYAGFAYRHPVGCGTTIIDGNSTTPANVVLTSSTFYTIHVDGGLPGGRGSLRLQNLTLANTGRYSQLYAIGSGVVVGIANLRFGAVTGSTGSEPYQIAASLGATIYAYANYSIVGSAVFHALSQTNGQISLGAVTISITGSPAFTQLFNSFLGGFIDLFASSVTGSFTGQKYIAQYNGMIRNVSAISGGSAGVTTNGGQII